ncbi:MAG: hypothetical protein JXX29_03660 [Deltaproteobacteria bacterium]|nr:hypothetical protein [Deltaproteobacteria bacterium]MBN2670739.1 hypothetical protein [Deltaproteobacteria bacterium]
MNHTIWKQAIGALLAVLLTLGMAACSDDKKSPKSFANTDTDSTPSTDGDADSDSDSDADSDSDGDADGDSDSDADGDTDVETTVLEHISIQDIDLFQSVQVQLVRSRQTVSSNVPVVAGRDAMMRIYVATDTQWQNQNIIARVTLTAGSGDTDVYEASANISGSSSENSLSSTINIDIPAAAMLVGTRYTVELLDAEERVSVGTEDATRWPTSGESAMTLQVTGGPLRVVILPIRWLSDGSGRLPETTDSALASIENALHTLYPISELSLEVSAYPMDWSGALDADGNGWETLLNEVTNRRATDGVDGDVYYMGLFCPMEKFYDWNDPENSFCNYACVTGLSWQVTAIGDSYLRASIALGYEDPDTPVTVAHELGHAHGRLHSPSGGADYVDSSYPVSDGTLDVLGYGTRQEQLFIADQYFDFMGYDYPQWVSAYTYSALFDTITAVNAAFRYLTPTPKAPPTIWRQILIAMDGTGSFGIEIALPKAPSGDAVEVDLYDADNSHIGTVTGYFTAFADQPGGAVWFASTFSDATIAVIPEMELRVE